MRLRGLREHADAFTSSYEEDRAKPLSATEARLAPGSDDILWGAFAGAELVGVAGFGREPRAIRVDDAYYAKNHMILFLTPP